MISTFLPDSPPPDRLSEWPGREGCVGLVGLGCYTGTVADLCAEAGLRVAFAVDDRDGRDGDPFGGGYALAVRGIPILSAAEFAERAHRTPGLFLVAGRVETDGTATPTDSFVEAAAWAQRTLRQRLAHPSVFLDQVRPQTCPSRYAVFGFPGSGNVLTQHLVEKLFGTPAPVPTAWAMRASLAEHAFHTAAAVVRTALLPLAPTRVEFGPHEFGTMLACVERAGRTAVAFGVPSGRHHALRTYPSHSRPTAAAVAHYSAAGVPCVAVVRHPCETLLSQANKIARPARRVLDHPVFLDRAAGQLADWTYHLLANRDRLHVVRYEDLAGRGVGELRRLAAYLGRPLSDGEADALFASYLNRNLPADVPDHFYRGGSDKWRRAFTPADLQRVLARVPAAAFTAFGYPLPTAADLVPSRFTDPPLPASDLNAALLELHPSRPVPGTGIRVCGGDPDLVRGLVAALAAPDLRAVLNDTPAPRLRSRLAA